MALGDVARAVPGKAFSISTVRLGRIQLALQYRIVAHSFVNMKRNVIAHRSPTRYFPSFPAFRLVRLGCWDFNDMTNLKCQMYRTYVVA